MKCYIIYNPDDQLSSQLVLGSINSCKQYGIDPILYPGTFRSDIEKKLEKYQIRQSKHTPNMTLGELGCFISHYELWNKCVNDDIPLLILEHDIYMKQPLPDNVLDLFDDVLNLDYCSNYRKDEAEYNKCAELTGIPTVKRLFIDAPLINKVTRLNAKKVNISGAHAYIIKPEGAKKLLSAAHRDGFLPADVHINAYYVNISVTEPSVVRFCDFMMNKKNRVKFSSTKGYTPNV